MHQPGLDRSRWNVGRDGDLRHAQFFDIEQRQDSALERRKLFDCLRYEQAAAAAALAKLCGPDVTGA